MQTKPKANSIVTTTLADDGSAITWTVLKAGPDGSDASMTLKFNACSDAVRRRAMVHGFAQRIMDKAAISRNPATGKAASPADKFAAMRGLVDHYMSGSGDWSPAREAGVVGLDSVTLAAVVEATGKTHDDVRAMIAAGAEKNGVKQSEYLAALGTSGLVAPIVARIRGQRAGVSGDDLLAGMMAGE